jgi:hypothetical protein
MALKYRVEQVSVPSTRGIARAGSKAAELPRRIVHVFKQTSSTDGSFVLEVLTEEETADATE